LKRTEKNTPEDTTAARSSKAKHMSINNDLTFSGAYKICLLNYSMDHISGYAIRLSSNCIIM